MIIEKYIHYGNNCYYKDCFQPIRNDGWICKPSGGLWASPLNAKYGWREWVLDNSFPCKLNKWFIFILRDNARVLRITSKQQLQDLPKLENVYSKVCISLDFEKLCKDFDAILLLISKDQRLYFDLYGWDVDSLLVMNPDVVEVLS